jgi:hypothetical protein
MWKYHRRHHHHHRRPSPVRHLRLHEQVLHYQGRDMLTFTLAWVLPTTRVDGSALAATDIKSVLIRDSLAVDPTAPIILDPATTSFTTDDESAVPGAHAFSVSVIDQDGLESPPDVAVGTVPSPANAAPSPVSGLTITSNPS